MLSIVKLLEIKGQPQVKLDLPDSLRVGDPLALRFRIVRTNGGRIEELRVDCRFRIKATGMDASGGPPRRLLSVEPIESVPKWRSIKKTPSMGRRLSPSKAPRTLV
jgi:hypothetical protein